MGTVYIRTTMFPAERSRGFHLKNKERKLIMNMLNAMYTATKRKQTLQTRYEYSPSGGLVPNVVKWDVHVEQLAGMLVLLVELEPRCEHCLP